MKVVKVHRPALLQEEATTTVVGTGVGLAAVVDSSDVGAGEDVSSAVSKVLVKVVVVHRPTLLHEVATTSVSVK